MDIFEGKILKILKKNKQDISISEIAKQLGVDRHTASKHLTQLQKTKLIQHRNIGKIKLYRIAKNPIKSNTHTSIQSEDFNIIWNNDKAKKKKQSITCYKAYKGAKEKCENCPVEKTFITGEPQEQTITDWPGRKKVTIISKPIKNKKNDTIAVVEIMKK